MMPSIIIKPAISSPYIANRQWGASDQPAPLVCQLQLVVQLLRLGHQISSSSATSSSNASLAWGSVTRLFSSTHDHVFPMKTFLIVVTETPYFLAISRIEA